MKFLMELCALVTGSSAFKSISAIDTLNKVMVEITFEKNLNFCKREMCPDGKGIKICFHLISRAS